MDDLISREQAIDAVRATLLAWSFMPEWRDNKIIEAIEQLPPAQLSTNLAEVGTDYISRQAAIDAVMECYDNDELFEVYEWKLNELPPIQPKRIRGQWSIKGQAIDTVRGYWAKCSTCGHSVFGGGNYCSYCGSYNKGEVTT